MHDIKHRNFVRPWIQSFKQLQNEFLHNLKNFQYSIVKKNSKLVIHTQHTRSLFLLPIIIISVRPSQENKQNIQQIQISKTVKQPDNQKSQKQQSHAFNTLIWNYINQLKICPTYKIAEQHCKSINRAINNNNKNYNKTSPNLLTKFQKPMKILMNTFYNANRFKKQLSQRENKQSKIKQHDQEEINQWKEYNIMINSQCTPMHKQTDNYKRKSFNTDFQIRLTPKFGIINFNNLADVLIYFLEIVVAIFAFSGIYLQAKVGSQTFRNINPFVMQSLCDFSQSTLSTILAHDLLWEKELQFF